MEFEKEYQAFLAVHRQARTGERLRRLEEGHQQAEQLFLKQIWWPLFHHFQYLHPEYEVDDFKDGKRYLDFSYLRPGVRICFEIDGYGPHSRNISRWQFADNLERQNQLVIDGWTVIRFSYDQVKERPRRCQQIVQQVVGKWLGNESNQASLSLNEKEIIRLAIRKGEAIFPKEVEAHLKLSDRTVQRLLSELVAKKVLVPASGAKRIRSYRVGHQTNLPL